MSVYTLRNARGIELRATGLGGIILSLRTPDREGRLDDIVLGFDSPARYATSAAYFGAIVGRYANRIAGGSFTLDHRTYTLARNNGPNHLHGGLFGFDKVAWDVEPVDAEGERALRFRYVSPDGEEGYPGTIRVTVTYTLNNADELIFDYHATTDRATPINLTQHSYFNLAGHDSGDVLAHELTIAAERFTPIDEDLIPTGEIREVAGTPLDFRTPTAIGSRIGSPYPQLRLARGYDHNYVIDRPGESTGLAFAARVRDPVSGRVLSVHTTQPGMQLYTGNFLDGVVGKGGAVYGRHAGLALETQHFPDSPNQPTFPSTILRPGEEFRSRTVLAFSVEA